VKIVAEKETRRVVGGEIIGGEDVTQRINALSLAIQNMNLMCGFDETDGLVHAGVLP
jgi:pyruvate/2-oxoglutarate dehydrogenase complex dihydrolipoamide dehydrogenase (E3) component